MLFFIKLAWRNIFRNKRRTFIAGVAIAVGLASLIFCDALIRGMKDNLIASATASFLGEGQIHARGFRETQDAEKTVNNLPAVLDGLKSERDVELFTLRTISLGMISSPANVSSVLFVGVNPETERRLSRVDDVLEEGSYFRDGGQRDMVLGSDLAELLEVGLGDRVVVTVSRSGSGDLAQEMFRVSGIFRFHIKEMDGSFALARIDKTREMLGLDGGAHEIALKFRDNRFAADPENPFWDTYSREGNEAVSWTALLPELTRVMDMVWFALGFLAVILFGIVVFGIINTLFMSLYERMFEFGVLRAVGTRPSGVRKLIVCEAGALAVLSIVMGSILGLVLTFVLAKTGIDYRGIEFAGTGFSELLYPVLHASQFFIYPAAVFVFTILVGLYPARAAGRLRVADALRKSL